MSPTAHAGLVLFAFAFGGGVLPLVGRWSERLLHLFAAVSAGVFLGLVFLHLLPALGRSSAEPGAASNLPWLCTLVGFLGLFFVEKAWLEGRARRDPHRAAWYASYVGLLVHTGLTGLGLAGLLEATGTGWLIVGATAAHKAGEAFSLATLMRLAAVPARRGLGWLAVYAAAAPAGLAAGRWMAPHESAAWTGLACGTFLYVAACDLLPEVFHGRDPAALKIGCVLGGVALAGGIELLPGP
jgi:zinc transporter ZupT